VSATNFSDAALVVVGHGSTRNVESGAPVFQHAASLRGRGLFASVHEAFWKQEPDVKQVLAGLNAPRIFIAPLFISEGYFSSQVIPRELGFPEGESRLKSRGSEVFYCQSVGMHPGMTEVLLARAREVVRQFPFPRAPRTQDTTLFVAGHGTAQHENSRQAVEHQVEQVRARNDYAAVHALFLEEEPRIGDCYRLAQTRHLVVVPLFVSDGMHTREDIPVLLGEPEHVVRQRLAAGQPAWRNPTEKNGKLLWYASAVGTVPELADVILERVREAAG
jgi:sirohydrochlorin cobaltochelatase